MGMVYRILWLSRHKPLESQLLELSRLFGHVQVVQDSDPFSSAEDIKQRFENGGYDDIVVVAPLSVIQRLTELGIKPLWAEMEVTTPEEAEVYASGRPYRFKQFKRIVAINIVYCDPKER